jgi:hypothetical protein
VADDDSATEADDDTTTGPDEAPAEASAVGRDEAADGSGGG